MLLGPYTVKPLIMLAGYLWPSYQTYKAVSVSNNVQLKFWCIYWMIIGLFLTLEWLADALVFWLPLYYEAKLLLILYLWHPRFYGAVMVYEKVVMPLMKTHEANIDSSIESTRARITDSFSSQLGRLRDMASQNTSSIIEAARKFSETAADNKAVKDGVRKNLHAD